MLLVSLFFIFLFFGCFFICLVALFFFCFFFTLYHTFRHRRPTQINSQFISFIFHHRLSFCSNNDCHSNLKRPFISTTPAVCGEDKTNPFGCMVKLQFKRTKKPKPHQQRKNKNKEIEPVLLLGNSFCPLEQSFKNYKQAVMISEEIR